MFVFKEIQVEVFVGVEIIFLFYKFMILDIIYQNYLFIKCKKFQIENQYGLILENGNVFFEFFFGEVRIFVDIISIGMDIMF